jgi:hypothetical protein
MTSAIGKLPFSVRQDQSLYTAWYHNDDKNGEPICGSNFHALAQIIQNLIQENKLDAAIIQINKCIDARKEEMNKRSNPDPVHNHAIECLRNLRTKIVELKEKEKIARKNSSFFSLNPSEIIIKYSDSKREFEIIKNSQRLGGRKRKTYKKNKIYIRKYKSRRRKGVKIKEGF